MARLRLQTYMEACLYDPEFGYYSGSVDRRRADYYTSVDVSPVFGRLLARQLEEMWRALDRPAQFTIVEGGAAAGALARHFLDFRRGAPAGILFSTCTMWLRRFRLRDGSWRAPL